MAKTEETILTERQLQVLELRERGYTQQDVADEIGTTDANVSAIERAATENIEKARRTLELVRTVRAPVQFTVPEGTTFDELVEHVYERSDDAGIKVDYCRPELQAHLYGELKSHTEQNKLGTAVTVGLNEQGQVKLFTDTP